MSSKPSNGFVFKAFAPDNTTKVFVSVTGHESVGRPLHPNGEAATDEHVESKGIDNLQVPIAVGNVVEDYNPNSAPAAAPTPKVSEVKEVPASTAGKPSKRIFCVEVVVHPCISSLCRTVWAAEGGFDALPDTRKHLIFRVINLAIDWIQRENGIVLLRETVKLVTSTAHRAPVRPKNQRTSMPSHFDPSSMTKEQMEAAMKEMAADFQKQHQEKSSSSKPTEDEEAGDVSVPSSLRFTKEEAKDPNPPKQKRPMVQEMGAASTDGKKEPVVRKGFLNDNGGKLYGDRGTNEGVLPDGAGDPLGYLPKSLREKCKVVDAREGTDAHRAMTSSNPAAQIPEPTESEAKKFVEQLNDIGKKLPAQGHTDEIDSFQKALADAAFSADHSKSKTHVETKDSKPHSSGITIEDVCEDNDEGNGATKTQHVDVLSVGNGWKVQRDFDRNRSILTLSATSPESGPSKISELDVTVEGTMITCDLDSDDATRCWSLGRQDVKGLFLSSWTGLPEPTGDQGHLLVVDEDASKAKFVSSKRTLILTLPLVQVV